MILRKVVRFGKPFWHAKIRKNAPKCENSHAKIPCVENGVPMGPAWLPHQTEGIKRLARERKELLVMVLHPIHDLFACVDAETAADGTVLRRYNYCARAWVLRKHNPR